MNTASSIQNHPQYLTEQQVSSLTAIAVKTLQGMRVKGNGIPYIKVGRLVRYNSAKVHEYMALKTKLSTSEE